MKKILYICILIVAAIALFACVKDYFTDGHNERETRIIAEAKAFFDKEMGNIPDRTLAISPEENIYTPGEFTPMWEKAAVSGDETGEVVTVPLLPDYQYNFFWSVFAGSKAKVFAGRMQQNLVITRSNVKNEMAFYIETTIPDKSCADKLKNGFYTINSEKFSGVVMRHTYYGDLVWFYKINSGKKERLFFTVVR